MATGCLSATYSVAAVATYLLSLAGVVPLVRGLVLLTGTLARPYTAHAPSENSWVAACAAESSVAPSVRGRMCFYRAGTLLGLADCTQLHLRATVGSCDLAGFLDFAPPLALVDGIFHRLRLFYGS